MGRLGEAGVVVSALALGAMALGNGIELYTVMTRGTESEMGHTIFLIAFLVLMVASVLVGQMVSNKPFSFTISMPPTVKCCAATLKWCIRYVITLEDCTVCNKLVCYTYNKKGCP